MSPIDGIVVEREKDPGEYVEKQSLLTVVSLNPLNVEVVVPAERFGTIKKGMKGNVTLMGPLRGSYKAKVVLIDQVIDAASDTIRVRLALPNPKQTIPAGLKCNVSFMQDKSKPVAKTKSKSKSKSKGLTKDKTKAKVKTVAKTKIEVKVKIKAENKNETKTKSIDKPVAINL